MPDTSDIITGQVQTRLQSIVSRIERLNEDKAAVAADLAEVFKEAAGEGFNVKILRKVVKLRATDKAKQSEEDALIELYMAAIDGYQPDMFEATAA